MENTKIALEQEQGNVLDFNIDSEVLEGLYLTMNNDLIIENINTFDLDAQVIPNQVNTKISKKNNVAIITIVVDENRKYQYLVNSNLDIAKVENMTSNFVPEQMKGLIREAYLMLN